MACYKYHKYNPECNRDTMGIDKRKKECKECIAKNNVQYEKDYAASLEECKKTQPKLETIRVKVGSGDKVHRQVVGSSQTVCGYWVGSHGIYKVDGEVTCTKCGC